MGDLIQFPERKVISENFDVPGHAHVEFMPDKCSGHLHVFVGVPGRCECGETTWGEMPDGLIGINHHVA